MSGRIVPGRFFVVFMELPPTERSCGLEFFASPCRLKGIGDTL
jgi:hypothetical protein